MRKINLFLLLRQRERDRLHQRNQRESAAHRLVIAMLGVFSILFIGGIAAAGYFYAQVASDLPSMEELPLLMDRRNGELLQPTTLLDRTGEVTLYSYKYAEIKREFLSVNPEDSAHVSTQFTRLVTASLEPDFWESPGYSIREWRNPEPQTIAERLVDDLLLWDEPDSINRSLRMRLLAAQVTSRYGAEKVLEWYINSAWFGEMAYGVESASQLYLQKSARDLSLSEAAMLIPLLDSPALNPLSAPETAVGAQRDLLKQNLSSGAIHQEEYSRAVDQVIVFREPLTEEKSPLSGFIRKVEDQLEDNPGYQRLRRGGLVVTTTLNTDLQQQLTCATFTQLDRIQGSSTSSAITTGTDCPASLLLPTQSFTSQPQGSISSGGLVVSPTTGEVLAYLEPIKADGESATATGYQPGSLLSSAAAVASFARGYSPSSLVWDVPSQEIAALSIPSPQEYRGAINLRSALANDYLIPIASLVNQFGASRVWRTGADLGLESLASAENSVLPLYSGAEASLEEITAMFTTLANSGVRSGVTDKASGKIRLNTVLWVETTSGRIILENSQPERSVIVSDALVYLVNHVLSDESARWSSLGYPNVLEIGASVAARTGTAANGHQVWTVGYDPGLLTLIWLGDNMDEREPSSLDVRMPAGIWHAVFRYAARERVPSTWVRPASVTEMRVCVPSGMLPTSSCPKINTDVFLMGNEPTVPDSLYYKVKINRETGQRATVFTALDLVEERTYMDVPPQAREWAEQAGIALAPSGYDAIQQVRIDPEVNLTSPVLFSSVSGKVTIRGTASGESFSSFTVQVGEGINPDNWTQLGPAGTRKVSAGTLATWDTSGLDGLYAIRLTVVDEDNLIRTALSQVTVDNTPPLVQLKYPSVNERVEPLRGGVTLVTSVSDQVGISRLEWWLDGKLISTQTTPPFVYFLQRTNGKYQVQLKVWDLAGNRTESEKVSFTITP